jgi:uncharacterized protein (TIGR03067 family)
MSKRVGVVLVLCCFLIGADKATKSDQSKKDLAEMQGDWQAVTLEVKGKPSGADEVKKIKLIVKKDDYRVKVDGTDHVSAKLVLRADKKPKELDLVLETGPVYKGIYEIDGNTLKICLSLSSDADSERPREFESKEGSSTALFTWARTN